MTNSVDKAASAAQPAPKKQGPIRFEAIIPLAIIAALVALYFMLFFDAHLRRGLEYVATQANGAEVNIGKLDTSVWKASVVVGEIEMTNPELPARNRLQVGTVTFRMLWDALLRGKILIDEASIVDVQVDTLRKKAGRVLPVEKPREGEGFSDKVLAQLQEEFSGNVLGDLAAIAAGADPGKQLASMGVDLKSGAYLDGLQKSLEEKKQQWQSRMAAMPGTEDFSALQRRLASVKLDNLQDVAQLQASLRELDAIRSDFEAKTKTLREAGAALTGDLDAFKGSYSELDKIVKEDVRSMQAQMHLPALDVRTLSRALFGMDVLGKMQQARGYMDQARSYMPEKSEKKQAVAAPERRRGRNYAFGKPNSYPRFWLRKALISSRLSGSDLSGQILDASTDPSMTGRPLVATIKGNFPQQGISGIKAELVIDHTTSVPVERMVMEVGRYGVAGRALVNSPNVGLGFSKAEGAVKFTAELREDNVDVRLNNRFTKVSLETRAQSEVVREMINASVIGLDTVNLDAHVTGTWARLDWQLSTNLAAELERGMRRYLQGKMDEARARIETMVNGRIAGQRKQLQARQGEIEASLKSALAERQAQIDKVRAELDGARNKLEERKKALLGAQQQKLKQGTDKLLDNLRKKF
ncbi:MAG: TIGR03545 family protein [Nitrosomonadales bacterium]|nr:TIGR03545 family protein [Nitrosomonadales bacterium]